MGLFNKSKDDSNAFIRKGEEAYYHQALTELESGKVNKGVYAKALGDSSGDEAKAQSLYLKYRVQSIADEGAIEVLEQLEKEQNQKQKKGWFDKLVDSIVFWVVGVGVIIVILNSIFYE